MITKLRAGAFIRCWKVMLWLQEVCGEAKDGREAVELAARLKPDLILLDIGMPNHLNGARGGAPDLGCIARDCDSDSNDARFRSHGPRSASGRSQKDFCSNPMLAEIW